MTPAQEIEVVSKTDKAAQRALLARADSLLDKSRASYESLARYQIELGIVLTEIQKSRAWLLTGCKTLDEYIKSCEEKFGRGRSALYNYRNIAEYLLPTVPEEDLIAIGVTKAQALASFVKKKRRPPTDKLLSDAKNPKVGIEEFRATIAEATHDKPEKGTWYEFGGAFVTPEEKEEFERGFASAATTDPALPTDVPDWLARKLVLQRLIAEFFSAYGHIQKTNKEK